MTYTSVCRDQRLALSWHLIAGQFHLQSALVDRNLVCANNSGGVDNCVDPGVGPLGTAATAGASSGRHKSTMSRDSIDFMQTMGETSHAATQCFVH